MSKKKPEESHGSSHAHQEHQTIITSSASLEGLMQEGATVSGEFPAVSTAEHATVSGEYSRANKEHVAVSSDGYPAVASSDGFPAYSSSPGFGMPAQQSAQDSMASTSYAGEAPEDWNWVDVQQRYEDRGHIARGGMSQIHRVFDRYLLRDTAMKVIDARLAEEDVHVHRFIEEAQVSGQLEHPNIVPVYELGRDQHNAHYFTMKLVEGKTLQGLLREDDANPSSEVWLYGILQVFLRVCDAISFAHSRGVIHRDLKPPNVMVGSYGQVYVMDWGIALVLPQGWNHATSSDYKPIHVHRHHRDPFQEEEGEILGTWNYMAPEQALGRVRDIGPWTDVFALGAILYEILTGSPPYVGGMLEILAKVQKGEVVPPMEKVPGVLLPVELCQIAMRAMSPQIQDRYSSVAAFKEEIENFLRGGGQLPFRVFAAGEQIIQEGDYGDTAYVITRGHCRVYKMINGKKTPLCELGPGDTFGEMAVFLAQTRTASVEAIDDVSLTLVTKDLLSEKLELGGWMGRFVKALANRFHDIDKESTSQKKQLEDEQLINSLFAYISLFNESASDNQRAAMWSTISGSLAQKFGWSLHDLQARVEAIGLFRIDLHKDMISFSLRELSHYLDHMGIQIG